MRGVPVQINPGDRFGRLTVIREDSCGHRRYFICQCDCGRKKRVRLDALTEGITLSCGCYNREISKSANSKHGCYKTRIYRIWAAMRQRCLNSNSDDFSNYGGRGITICEEWSNFNRFKEWALTHGYDKSLSIDRIDVNGNYEPSNCRWITMDEQRRNTTVSHRITYCGETKTLRQWGEIASVSHDTISARLKRGWSIEDALMVPAYGERP